MSLPTTVALQQPSKTYKVRCLKVKAVEKSNSSAHKKYSVLLTWLITSI